MGGVSLSHLIPTFVYDLDPSTVRHLITLGCAEELPPSRPALVVPIDEPGVLEVLTRGVSVSPGPAAAADKPRRQRKKRR